MTSLPTPAFIPLCPATAGMKNTPFSAAAQAIESKEKVIPITRTNKAQFT